MYASCTSATWLSGFFKGIEHKKKKIVAVFFLLRNFLVLRNDAISLRKR
jgi:hypothetical protein